MDSRDVLLAQLRATLSKMEIAFGAFHDPIVWTDVSGRIQWGNQALSRLVNRRQIEYLGADASTLIALQRDGLDVSAEDHPVNLILETGDCPRDTFSFAHAERTLFLQFSGSRYGDVNEPTGSGVVLVARDVTAQEEVKRAMRLAENAERVSEAKTMFLSSVSHEIRTPLNAVLGFAQLLELDRTLTEKQRGRVGQILKAGSHLIALINDILDLSRVESGRLELTLETVEVGQFVDEIMEIAQPIAKEAGITVLEDVATQDDLVVFADRTRLRQVLLNLVSNAIKYNREGGSVTISCQPEARDRIMFSITDTGIGIPNDKLIDLFEPFERLGADQTRVTGTGIGLTICKRLIEMMNGEIGVESDPGVGSRFYFDLPTHS